MKAPGTKRLKLEYDTLLSNFAFKFNLRRCIKAHSRLATLYNELDMLADAGAAYKAEAYPRPLFSST